MSILFSGDFQAEWGNLDRCQDAWEEILDICQKQKLKYIVVLGDLKQAMNPVDVRVITWWQNAIRTAIKLHRNVIILLGNHDRVGAYSNADNWLSILRRAGATTFDKAGTYKADEVTVYMLPYMGIAETRIEAKKLAKKVKGKNNILCFHQDLTGARYNQQGSKSDGNLSTIDLKCSSFSFCIGGHIHLPQKIGENTYYVGSPFCHDWGEVNQRKRYIVVRKDSLRSVYSSIPGWFDGSVGGFESSRPKTWNGARVRVTVLCDASEDYGKRLEKYRRRADAKYKEAEIYVVPKFTERSTDGLPGYTSNDSDERKIRSYVEKTRYVEKELAIEYMLKVLSQFEGGLRQDNKVKFIRALGRNFLSFKNVDLDLTKKGITLVQGINDDRNSKSNGAGKTSLVQQIPVALFGKSFKLQKSDSWANRFRPKEPAFAEVIFQIQGKTIKILRGRRPVQLRMYVDGKEVSSGMKSNDKTGTQEQIEKVTGFTWSTLANAVYIDRMVADAFLSGTKSQRTSVLSRFQNLERFEDALERVKRDIKGALQQTGQYEQRLASTRSAIEHIVQAIKDIKYVSSYQLKDAHNKYKKADKELNKYRNNTCKQYQSLVLKAGYNRKDFVRQQKRLKELAASAAVLVSKEEEMDNKLRTAKKLKHKRTCPTCLQKVKSKWSKIYQKGIVIVKKDIYSKYKAVAKKVKAQESIVDKLSDRDDYLQDKLSKIKTEEARLESTVKTLRRQYEELQGKEQSALIKERKQRLKKLENRQQVLKHELHKESKLLRMYEYVSEAFSRDGIPAYLNRQLCPLLNKASAYYADLFSDGEVQVQFTVEGGEFVPKIINTSGGADIGDQSEGEKALAGLISSFALREAAPECNLLILDEPGAGLDDATARQFARALRKLVKRFKSIFVVTHNNAISSELGNERIITVRKHHKINRVEAV